MSDEIKSFVSETIATILGSLNIRAEIVFDDSMQFGARFNVEVAEARFLIGERGANLAALEYLVKRITQKKFPNSPNFSLDVNDYRLRRAEDLKEDVKSIAKKVRMYRKEITLRPMSAGERRIIHMALAEYPDITTESIGENRERRVVIKPYP